MEAQRYPYDKLKLSYPEVQRVWDVVSGGYDLQAELPFHLQAYAREVRAIYLSRQDFAVVHGKKLEVTELDSLLSTRLYKLTQFFLGLESGLVSEEDLVLDNESTLIGFLYSFTDELRAYLRSAKAMVTLTEGRLQLDRLCDSLFFAGECLRMQKPEDDRTRPLVKEYFEQYGKAMKVFNREEIEWSFLHGLVERTLHLSRKSVYYSNHLGVSYALKGLSRSSDEVLGDIPAVLSFDYRRFERKFYQKMINDLVFLRKIEKRKILRAVP